VRIFTWTANDSELLVRRHAVHEDQSYGNSTPLRPTVRLLGMQLRCGKRYKQRGNSNPESGSVAHGQFGWSRGSAETHRQTLTIPSQIVLHVTPPSSETSIAIHSLLQMVPGGRFGGGSGLPVPPIPHSPESGSPVS
jgi:hypothetical protein